MLAVKAAPVVLYCPMCGIVTPMAAQFCYGCGATLPVLSEDQVVQARMTAQPRYAKFWPRAAALAIDWVLVNAVVWPVSLLFAWSLTASRHALGLKAKDASFYAGFFAVVLWIIADWLYHSLMNSSERQATFGKKWLRLKVTNMEGERIGFGCATGRYFAKFLSTFMLMFGFLLMLWTKQRQTLHDIVAGTLVLKK